MTASFPTLTRVCKAFGTLPALCCPTDAKAARRRKLTHGKARTEPHRAAQVCPHVCKLVAGRLR
ncbi:hypothetical protein BURKHO8Y_140278 [Burkholderia sp. 8Y]|nr:hypothetical protein BURKHO8Y_140278 [Burkholderia sp. 8Y]